MSNLFGLVVKGKENKIVPLQDVTVSGNINGYLYGLETRLSYRNDSDDPLEVMFRFPVDESSAVVGMEAIVDGRKIKGEVKEKEEARQMYDDAMASGLTAALGEEKTKDIFSLALGNLPPKGEAQIFLKLCGELALDKESKNAARFSLPTVLKPRYTPSGSTDPLAAIGGGASQVEKGSAPAVSNFSLVINRADGVSSVTSPTHTIKTTPKGDSTTEVTLTNIGLLDKDIVILVEYQDRYTPKAIVEVVKEPQKGNELMSNPAVMLEFFPQFSALQAACEFLFVIDRSGSMSGAYINSARDTMVLFLKSIPPGCFFNIIGFGSRYEHLFSSSVPYNQSNLDTAMTHAQSLKADLGGTELLRPLEYIFKQKVLPGLPRQVFVLTDGSVSNTDACINLTRKNVHIARVFTFGIGSGASTALVKGLARAGNGSSEFIKEGERMQGKVISSLKKALQPSVSDIELKFSVPNGIEVMKAPNDIPPIFNGEKIVLYGLLKGGNGKQGECSAVLSGKMLGSDVHHKIDFQFEGAPTDAPIVHQLAAKSLIQDWEGNSAGDKKSAIIKLSIESSVVSSHTSYIAVDEEQNKPIMGAIKTYDLTYDLAVDNLALFDCFSAAPAPILLSSPFSSYGGPPPPPPGGMSMMCGMGLGGVPPPPFPSSGFSMDGAPPPPPSNMMFNAPPPPAPSYSLGNSSYNVQQSARLMMSPRQRNNFGGGSTVDDLLSFDDFSADCNEISADLFGDFSQVKNSAPKNRVSNRSTFPNVGGSSVQDLTQLISLQTAEGYWKLDQSLASVLGNKTLSNLKSLCPKGCSELVWGTVLALAMLQTKYTSQRDEWELLCMKSEMWLQSQTLPTGVTIDSLVKMAEQILK